MSLKTRKTAKRGARVIKLTSLLAYLDKLASEAASESLRPAPHPASASPKPIFTPEHDGVLDALIAKLRGTPEEQASLDAFLDSLRDGSRTEPEGGPRRD